jgi:hypothetical protein
MSAKVLVCRSSLSSCTYSSAGDGQLNLTTGSAHEGTELLGNTLKLVQSVVLGQSLEEVLDGVVLVLDTEGLLDLGNDLRLVGFAEGGGLKDSLESGISLEGGMEVLETLCGGIQRVGLDSGSVKGAGVSTVKAEESDRRLRSGGRGRGGGGVGSNGNGSTGSGHAGGASSDATRQHFTGDGEVQ